MQATARNLLFGAIAAAALVGAGGLAEAGNAKLHAISVRLPDGGRAIVEYTGDMPPKVSFERAPWFAAFGGLPGLSAFTRMEAQMDSRMQAMMRKANAMAKDWPNADRLFDAGFGAMPKGGRGYSFFSGFSSDGVCARSITVTSNGAGERPRVEQRMSGDCGKTARADADKGI
ncbi:MAG TPA: hypothetical protein VHC42_10465 [Rhizomicrobium sp.]|nr:hypothetical protein [Rhizomicrobium sp.]